MPLRSIRPSGLTRLAGRPARRGAFRTPVPIEKAAKKGTPAKDGRVYHQTADELKGDLKKAIRDALVSLRRSVDASGLERAIKGRDTEAVLAAIPLASVEAAMRQIVQPVLLRIIVGAANEELTHLRSKRVVKAATTGGTTSATISLSFDYRSAEAIKAAQTMTGKLITRISDDQRAAIRDLMGQAFQKGWPPREVAKLIAYVLDPAADNPQILSVVGLYPQLSTAVANRYFAALDAAETKYGAVSDAVYERIYTQTAAYADSLLDYRSEMIARTETIDASTEGQYALWDAGVSAGQIDPTASAKQWIYTADERSCDDCEALDGQTVGLDENFQSDGLGDVDGPPAHPMCRCTTGLVFGADAAEATGEENSASDEMSPEEPSPEEEG